MAFVQLNPNDVKLKNLFFWNRNKDGKWVARSREVEAADGDDDDNDGDDAPAEDVFGSDDDDDDSDESDDEEKVVQKPVSVVQIVAKRKVLLSEAKLQVGPFFYSCIKNRFCRLKVILRFGKSHFIHPKVFLAAGRSLALIMVF